MSVAVKVDEGLPADIRLAKFLLAQLKLEDVAGAIVVISPDAIRVLRA